jgi:hypothetical protein
MLRFFPAPWSDRREHPGQIGEQEGGWERVHATGTDAAAYRSNPPSVTAVGAVALARREPRPTCAAVDQPTMQLNIVDGTAESTKQRVRPCRPTSSCIPWPAPGTPTRTRLPRGAPRPLPTCNRRRRRTRRPGEPVIAAFVVRNRPECGRLLGIDRRAATLWRIQPASTAVIRENIYERIVRFMRKGGAGWTALTPLPSARTTL